MELRRDKPLFDKKLVFQVTEDGNPESTETTYVFRILSGTQPSHIPGQTESLYYFELTDEQNSYFVYYFLLSEPNFPTYKRDQSVLVDFHDFPTNIIKLLESCLKANSITHGQLSADPATFMAKFHRNSGVFSIVEATAFKQTKYIELPLQLGDDNAIKMYLSSRLSLALRSNQRFAEEVDSLRFSLHEMTLEREASERRLYEFQTKRNAEVQELMANHQHELATQREKHLNERNEVETRHQQSEDQLKHIIDDVKLTYANYREESEKEKTEMQKRLNAYESQVSDLTRQLHLMTNERDRFEAESNDHLIKFTELEKTRSEQHVDLVKLDSRYKLLQQQYNDRDETLQKTIELNHSLEENKKALENHIQSLNESLISLQEQYHQIQEDLQTSLLQFDSLKQDYVRMKEEILKKNDVIRKQEALVIEVRQKTGDYEALYKKELVKSESQEKEIKKLKKELRECLNRVEESAVQLKKNQAMIDVLAKEAMRSQYGYSSTSAMVGGGGVGGADVFSSPLPQPYPSAVTSDDLMTSVPPPYNTASAYKTPTTTTATSNAPFPITPSSLPHTTLAKYQLTSYTGNTATTATASSSPASPLMNLPSKRTPPSSSYFPASSRGKQELLVQGIQSLGLSEDELKELNDVSYDFSSSHTSSTTPFKKSGGALSRKPVLVRETEDISLENIDFYAIKK